MKWLVLVAALLAGPALAVQPDEQLADPALEARARALSQELRCLVCRNESIDESEAPIARDLRLLVRERLELGESDAEIMEYVVARYGEFVLLNPPASGSTIVIWVAGPLLALIALLGVGLSFRGRRPTTEPLSAQERAEIAALLGDD